MIHKCDRKGRTGRCRAGALLLAAALLAGTITGCGKDTGQPDREEQTQLDGENPAGAEEQSGGNTTGQNPEEQSGGKEEIPENVAMGRYTEQTTSLSDILNPHAEIYDLKKLSDGSLVLLGDEQGPLASKTNGEAWDFTYPSWYKEVRGNYLLDSKVSADGTYGIIYMVPGDDDGDSEDYSSVAMLVRPDGTKIPIQADLTEDDGYLRNIWMMDSGRVFVAGFGDTIYEVGEDGTAKEFLRLEKGAPELVTFVDQIMVMDDANYEVPLLYDLEKEEYVEDQVLSDFVKEYYADRLSSTTCSYKLFLFPGEDGVLYLAGQHGLHRHVIGGGAMEQVIDGALSGFNDPLNSVSGMIALENGEFLAYFHTDNKLVHFTYDPDVPTVPLYTVRVYSLEENDTVRQAMTAYQTADPTVFVEYEVGMADGSVTREDALKTLNTKIMAGEGPDVLILDDMPLDSYIEKGLLHDLDNIITDMGGEDVFFANLIDAFRTDGGLYAVPCYFSVPVIAGDPEYVDGVTQLGQLADAMEQMRKALPDAALLDFYSEEMILQHFIPTCAPAWKKEDGALDTEALSEFLEQTKRIYDAQNSGGGEEIKEQYVTREAEWLAAGEDYSQIVSPIDYIGGEASIMSGTIKTVHSYSYLTSLAHVEGYEDTVAASFDGQGSKVFCPGTIVGITASSTDIGRAEAFVKILLGKDIQSGLYEGFAVNREGFEQSCINDYAAQAGEGEPVPYSSLAVSGEDGISVTLSLYWINDEQKKVLLEWIESKDTAYLPDNVLKDAVCKYGGDYLRGDTSLEDATAAVERAVELYLAE